MVQGISVNISIKYGLVWYSTSLFRILSRHSHWRLGDGVNHSSLPHFGIHSLILSTQYTQNWEVSGVVYTRDPLGKSSQWLEFASGQGLDI